MVAMDLSEACQAQGPRSASCDKSFGHTGLHHGIMNDGTKVFWRRTDKELPGREFEV